MKGYDHVADVIRHKLDGRAELVQAGKLDDVGVVEQVTLYIFKSTKPNILHPCLGLDAIRDAVLRAASLAAICKKDVVSELTFVELPLDLGDFLVQQARLKLWVGT